MTDSSEKRNIGGYLCYVLSPQGGIVGSLIVDKRADIDEWWVQSQHGGMWTETPARDIGHELVIMIHEHLKKGTEMGPVTIMFPGKKRVDKDDPAK